METAQAPAEESFYQNLETSRADKPEDYPADNYTDPNDKAKKLEGDINRIGPAIVFKVVAGDKIDLRVNSWYKHNFLRPRVSQHYASRPMSGQHASQ